jgi:hypothetical protein
MAKHPFGAECVNFVPSNQDKPAIIPAKCKKLQDLISPGNKAQIGLQPRHGYGLAARSWHSG